MDVVDALNMRFTVRAFKVIQSTAARSSGSGYVQGDLNK
jgi:hypothetical protein